MQIRPPNLTSSNISFSEVVGSKMSGEDVLLTEEDFFQCPPGYFACPEPDCRVESRNIVCDKTLDHLAIFRCVRIGCKRTRGQHWHKCRVCTYSRRPRLKRLSEHVRTMEHRDRVRDFIQFKNNHGIVTSNNDGGVSEPFSNGHDDCASDDFGANDESSDEPAITHKEPVAATVEEWKRLVLLNSPDAPQVLSEYFPDKLEKTPKPRCFRRPMNEQYYQYHRQTGHGPRLIYAQAIANNSSPVILNSVSSTNSLWSILFGEFVNSLTANQQQMLVPLMTHIKLNPKDSLPLPKDHAQLRNRYTTDGAGSVPNILPRPIIETLENGFVYVSIRGILQYHLANGQPLDPLVDLPYADNSSLRPLHGSSARGKFLVKVPPPKRFPTEVVIWSDGFDTNNTKNNRGSAHVVLISIGTPENRYHSGCNTYPVSLGPANGDMSEVVGRIVNDLNDLYEGNIKFYDSASGKALAVCLRVYCFLQDRPERCSWLSISYGNGKYAGRFGWAGDLSQAFVYKALSSCETCNKRRMESPLFVGNRYCQKCSDWCFDFVYYRVPAGYPTVFKDTLDSTCETNPPSEVTAIAPKDPRIESNGEYFLEYRKISFEDLITASGHAFDMVRFRHWTKKQGIVYLETFALNQEYISKLCNAAATPAEPKPDHPSTWNVQDVDISHHIDVLMHLCFLGITKANWTDLISGWLKSKRKSKSFLKTSSPVLARIKGLRLSWCKAETKFGGYVSENWTAYCRFSKYIHQLLSKLEATDEVYRDPPGVPLSEYTFKQKKAWLRAREVDGITSTSTKAVVVQKFGGYLSLEPNDLPPIVEPIASEATLDEVNHMVTCWHVCMSRIMCLNKNPTDEQVLDIDRHVKLFLTAVEAFDRTRQGRAQEKQKMLPVWRRKPNYLGLLNYKGTIQEMGPLPPLTELDLKGEASIKHLKCEISHGLKDNWSYNGMHGYYVKRSNRYVLKDAVNDVIRDREDAATIPIVKTAAKITGISLGASREETGRSDVDHLGSSRGKQYDTFESEAAAVDSLIAAPKFLSGIVIGGRFYLVIEQGGIKTGLEIQPLSFRKEVCGAHYCSYKQVVCLGEATCDVESATEFFMLLPLLEEDGTIPNDGSSDIESNAFYLATSKWREVSVSDDGRLILRVPTIPGAAY